MTTYVVPLSADGSLTLPSELAARWQGSTVLAADLGDRLMLRALLATSAGAMRGKYRGRGPSTLDARAMERDG